LPQWPEGPVSTDALVMLPLFCFLDAGSLYNLRQVSSGVHRGADWEEVLHDADTAELYHFYQYWMLTGHFRFARRAFARNQQRRAARDPVLFDWNHPPARLLETVTADYTVVFLGPLDCEALSYVCRDFQNAQNWERVVEWAYLDVRRAEKLAWMRRRLRPQSIGFALRDRYFRTIRRAEGVTRWNGPADREIDAIDWDAVLEVDAMVARPVSTAGSSNDPAPAATPAARGRWRPRNPVASAAASSNDPAPAARPVVRRWIPRIPVLPPPQPPWSHVWPWQPPRLPPSLSFLVPKEQPILFQQL
jgi:hypothetical protein